MDTWRNSGKSKRAQAQLPHGTSDVPPLSITDLSDKESIVKHATPSEKKLGIRIPAIVFIPAMVALLAINLLTGAPYWVHTGCC